MSCASGLDITADKGVMGELRRRPKKAFDAERIELRW